MNHVLIFVAGDNVSRQDFERAVREHFASSEFIERPSEAPAETFHDAEQIPLWQWFVSSKAFHKNDRR
jgi:hypothetical protein